MVSVPGDMAGIDVDVLAACLAEAFGASYSPVEYGISALAILQVHSRMGPPETWLNGTQPFDAEAFIQLDYFYSYSSTLFEQLRRSESKGEIAVLRT